MTRHNGTPAAPSGPQGLTLPRPLAIALLGVSTRTFARLESEGAVTAVSKGTGRQGNTYDGPTIVAQFVAYREAMIRGSAHSPRDRRDASQAALNELKLERERRTLLPRDQVVREGAAVVAVLATKARQLPGRLVRAGVVPPDGEAAIATEVDSWQAELHGLTTLEVLQDP